MIVSNEWKDYQRDLRADFEHNFECALDCIPGGWEKSFIPQLENELFEALGSYADEIMFYQIKEKFGELTAFWNFPDRDYYTDEDYDELEKLAQVVGNIIQKYTEISKNTCAICGEAATHMTTFGWIEPLCEACDLPKLKF